MEEIYIFENIVDDIIKENDEKFSNEEKEKINKDIEEICNYSKKKISNIFSIFI